MTKALDENGQDAYYDDWIWACSAANQPNTASNGQRVTTALALQIAHDYLRWVCEGDPRNPPAWTQHDLRLARAAISGLRAQMGCEDLDPAVTDGYLTHFCDIAIYG